MRQPVIYCSDVDGERPQLADIRLVRPFSVTGPTEQNMLRRLAEFMRKHNCGATIEGYSDERGSEAAKQRAALQRAEVVRNYLVQGLPESERIRPDQLDVKGKGELQDPALPREEKQIARVVM
jgi:outer membrane protein OmpA-like peptidoglycan-associated protein